MNGRVPDWRERLDANIRAWKLRPFDWHSWNCCDFAAAHVLAMTGVDHRSRFRIRTNCREEYETFLEAAGGLAIVVSSVLGAPITLGQAVIGDLVCSDLMKGPMIAIMTAPGEFHAPSPRGLDRFGAPHMSRRFVAAWRV